LRHWFALHILKEDQALALPMKAIAEGAAPADAY
jgi:hemerythrin